MFQIGEFSKIALVSASLMRYDDDIDFKPIKSDRRLLENKEVL